MSKHSVSANTTRIASLLATAAQREAQQEAPATATQTGMSLDAFYIALGRAAKADYQNGLLTEMAYTNRKAELKTQYNQLKGRA